MMAKHTELRRANIRKVQGCKGPRRQRGQRRRESAARPRAGLALVSVLSDSLVKSRVVV